MWKKLILLLLLISCKQKNLRSKYDMKVLPPEVHGAYYESDNYIKQDVDDADLKQYNGKIIKSIEYCDNCATGGNVIYINFTDGSKIRIYNYKYKPQILYPW